MKAFIGHSFDEKDSQVITKIIDFIKSLDIDCVDAKPAKPKTVEEKITELIKGCDIFVGIFSNYLKTDNRQRRRYQNNKQASLISAR